MLGCRISCTTLCNRFVSFESMEPDARESIFQSLKLEERLEGLSVEDLKRALPLELRRQLADGDSKGDGAK